MNKQHKKRIRYRRMFEYRSEPLIMVSYAEHNFTYRLFDPSANHIIVSRDFAFDEVTVKECPTGSQTQAKTIKVCLKDGPRAMMRVLEVIVEEKVAEIVCKTAACLNHPRRHKLKEPLNRVDQQQN